MADNRPRGMEREAALMREALFGEEELVVRDVGARVSAVALIRDATIEFLNDVEAGLLRFESDQEIFTSQEFIDGFKWAFHQAREWLS
jgi:hypothetical protein